jgi:hypothetical protein
MKWVQSPFQIAFDLLILQCQEVKQGAPTSWAIYAHLSAICQGAAFDSPVLLADCRAVD